MNNLCRWGCVALLAMSVGCDDGDDAPGTAPADAAAADASSADAGAMVDTGAPDQGEADATVPDGPDPDPNVLGRCVYVNPFTDGDECKGYTGGGWTAESAAADCESVFLNTAGTFEPGFTCGYENELGYCEIGDPEGEGYVLINAGEDPTDCGLAQTGCEGFGMGTFEPRGVCVADDICPPVEPTVGAVFVQPYEDCRDPIEGEAPGLGPNGQVCTPVIVSGCTEPGRAYADYASCDDIRTQRPYSAYMEPIEADPNDPRLADDAYMAELEWFKGEVESCACACCHTESVTADGASLWDTEAGALWIDTIPDTGLAMLAGWVDSAAFGAVDPANNNGFDRLHAGQPTTDTDRLVTFLAQELARRGRGEEDFADVPAFGGPLAFQATFEPNDCARGQGVQPDGSVVWTGGAARYVYVLPAGAANPGVPPNRDLPADTLWQVQVPSDNPQPLACGIQYGDTPEGTVRRAPEAGDAPALVAGERYYLYVLRDVGLPLTRCVFTYEGE